jgi:hypothetical protein
MADTTAAIPGQLMRVGLTVRFLWKASSVLLACAVGIVPVRGEKAVATLALAARGVIMPLADGAR